MGTLLSGNVVLARLQTVHHFMLAVNVCAFNMYGIFPENLMIFRIGAANPNFPLAPLARILACAAAALVLVLPSSARSPRPFSPWPPPAWRSAPRLAEYVAVTLRVMTPLLPRSR